jgi:hypothetical protein
MTSLHKPSTARTVALVSLYASELSPPPNHGVKYDGVVFQSGKDENLTGSQGGNNPFSANGVFVADDFTLGNAASIRHLIFNAFTASDTVPITTVALKFYEDLGGKVGKEIYSQITGIDGESATADLGYYILKDFSVALPGVELGAGSYFVGLNVNPAQGDMHWTITDQVGSPALYGDSTGNADAYGGFEQPGHFFVLTDK